MAEITHKYVNGERYRVFLTNGRVVDATFRMHPSPVFVEDVNGKRIALEQTLKVWNL